MSVKWKAEFDNGWVMTGSTQDGSWRDLMQAEKPNKIIRVEIFNHLGGGRIDDFQKGYFISNKIIASLSSEKQKEFVAIGYYQENSNVVRIKWYDNDTMLLSHTEARSLNSCLDNLIINP